MPPEPCTDSEAVEKTLPDSLRMRWCSRPTRSSVISASIAWAVRESAAIVAYTTGDGLS